MREIDDELREHFQALREVDLARIPSFAALTRNPAHVRRARKRRVRWVFVGGAGALAAAAMLTVLVQRRREAEWLNAAATISRWQPPTDALLVVSSGGPFGGDPIALGASVLDSIIPAFRED
jgi:hypothetical protein